MGIPKKLGSLLAVVALFSFLAAGCAEEDSTPPPSPRVDAVVSPTSLPTQVLTGTAEYGATITVEGGADAVETVADYFTASFEVEVSLNQDSENAISVTATDSAGNDSEPTMVTIVHEPAHPEGIELTIEPEEVSADVGQLKATVQISNDELEVALSDFVIDFTISGDFTRNEQAATDAGGKATVTFTGLNAIGSGTVTATWWEDPEDPEDPNAVTATKEFLVVGGAPVQVDLKLSDGEEPLDELTTVAGTEVTAETIVTDAGGNVLDIPVGLSTDAPALISGSSLLELTRAGDFTVVATVLGTWVSDSAGLHVLPDAPASAEVQLSAGQMAAGESVTASAATHDIFGNQVPGETFTLSVLEPVTLPGVPVVDNVITIESPAGSFTVRATLDSDGTIFADAPLSVLPGPVALFTLELDDADDPGDIPAASLTVAPDSRINITVTIEDAFGNAVDSPFFLTTDAPGLILGSVLAGVTAAGDYTVMVTLTGTANTAAATLTVNPGAPAGAVATLDRSQVAAGTTVTATAAAFDAFGNEVPNEPFTYSVLEPVSLPLTPVMGNTITIESPAGSFTVRATLDSDSSIFVDLPLSVVPGPMEIFTLELDDATDPGDSPATSLAIDANTDVNITVTIQDSYGNDVSVPFFLSTDAPGIILDAVLTGVTLAGDYTVIATLTGTASTASADLTVEPGAPASALLALDQDRVMAGIPVTASATAFDAYGNPVAGETFTYSVLEPVNSPPVPVAGNIVTIESPAGSFTVRATLDSDPAVTADAPLDVTAADPDPANFVFDLLDPATGNPADPVGVTAGTDVDFEYFVFDAFGNPISPVTVDLSINAPGSLVANNGLDGGTISLLRRAGSYTVVAQVRGTAVVGLRTLDVAPAAADRITLTLSSNLVPLGDPVTVFFTVVDIYGNEIPNPQVQLACSDATAVFSGDPANAVSGDQVTINQPGTFSITATETISGASDIEYVTAEQAMDFVPPVVDIDSPAGGTQFAPGSPVIVIVSASDNAGLMQVGYRTRGAVEEEDFVLEPSGILAVTESFNFIIPANRFGQITIYAWAEDESGNTRNANPVTVFSQLPNSIVCSTCSGFYTEAAGYDEGGIIGRGRGGIRRPQEIAVGSGSEIYVALRENIMLSAASGFFGTDQEEVYISLIMPDGSVDPFATLTSDGDIANQETIGLTLDPVSGALYASLFRDITGVQNSRVISFTPGGSVVDPFSDALGTRELGLFYVGGRLIAIDDNPDPDRGYVVDTPPFDNYLFDGTGFDFPNSVADICGDDTTLYITSMSEVHTCSLAIGNPSTCGPMTMASSAANVALIGILGSCALSPFGQIIVANYDNGTVVTIDPAGASDSNATELITGMQRPVGVAFDPNTDDLLVSDEAMDAVFRFMGSF